MQYAPTAPYSVKPNRQRHFLTRVQGFSRLPMSLAGFAISSFRFLAVGRAALVTDCIANDVPGSSAWVGKFPWTTEATQAASVVSPIRLDLQRKLLPARSDTLEVERERNDVKLVGGVVINGR